MNFRVGLGQDSHKFSTDQKRKLFLGGFEVPNEIGLEGNSDADVVIHAICRALEQAIDGDSFSVYADEMSKDGINDSKKYLKKAVEHVKIQNYKINNIGISIEANKPNISSIAKAMKQKLASVMEIDADKIGIGATSGEKLTAFGRGEGIQVFAIVTVVKNEKD
ncbi:MAG TPA: 2-C-methyl-D-erythritol 2,4-cyclodiphosphate synthase [Patescibacteria group bacterium]|nr:2-C-methyl-D-erythritol 2,4-cyclodiphosphate synthase [Patescibacteria group bacterium]